MNVFIDSIFKKYYEKFPLVLVDIGARGGTQSNWARAEPFLKIICFEPDPKEFLRLIKTPKAGISYINTALYREKRILELNLTRSRGASSIFKPNREFLDRFPESERLDILETIPIEADTLDHQLLNHRIHNVDFIKIDTQGSEMYILQGAQKTINESVFGIETEVEFAPIYEGQPLFAEVDTYIRNQGFHLFDLRPCYWKRTIGKNFGKPKGQIIFADALYLKNVENFVRIVDQMRDQFIMRSKVLRALSICILYGYLDYALEVIEARRELFDEPEFLSILNIIKNQHHLANIIPQFRGRGLLAGFFYKLYMAIHPMYNGWASGGKALGNLD